MIGLARNPRAAMARGFNACHDPVMSSSESVATYPATASFAGQGDRMAAGPSGMVTTVVLCVLAMIVEGFDTYAIGYVGPAISQAWALPQSTVGTLYATGVCASLVGSVALGAAADRLGRKSLLTWSCLLFGGATLLGAFAPSIEWLFLSRAVAGLGLGASIPCAMALAVESAPPRWRASTPIFLSAMIGAGNLSAGLSAAAVMPAYGWRGLLALGGALPLAVALAMPIFLRESPALAPEPRRRALLSELVTWEMVPRLLIVTTALFAIYMVTFFFGFWMPTLLHDITPDMRQVGLGMALIKTCSLAGSLLVAVLVARLGTRRVLPAVAVLAALALVLLVGRSDGFIGVVLGFGAASFFIDAAFSGAISLGAIVFPSRLRATGIGITIGVARLLGGTAGPMVGGILLDRHFGLHGVTATFAVPLILAAGLIWLALRTRDAAGAAL